ncbi:MAG: DUF3592 domain-containing protein [Spirochaetales bacterium]
MYECAVSYFWSACEGKVVVSEVTRTYRRLYNPQIYSTHIVYEYAVDGVKYQSSRRVFGPAISTGKSTQEKIAEKYPVGKIVTVYYEPKDPRNAVLERGIHFDYLLFLGIGFVFLSVGYIGYKYCNILNNRKPEFVRRQDLDKDTTTS